MIPFKLGDTSLKIYSSWDEVPTETLIQLKHMKNPKDFCEILSILTGCEYKLIADAEVSDITMQQLSLALKWMNNKINFLALPMPTFLKFGADSIKVVQDLGTKTLAQKSCFQQMIFPMVNMEAHENGSQHIVSIEPEAVPIALAIYFQPLITGKIFDPEHLDETIALAGKIPVTQSFPVANFFLRKYFGLESLKSSSSMNQRQKNLRRALNN